MNMLLQNDLQEAKEQHEDLIREKFFDSTY